MKPHRLSLAVFFAFVFIVGFEWVFHGVLLKGTYASTPQLWRTQEQMTQFFPYLTGAQLLLTLMLGWIWRQGYQGRGIPEGVRFGIVMGLLLTPMHVMWYAVQPLPGKLLAYWIIGGMAEMLAVGFLFAMICRPGPIKSKATPAESPA